MRIGFPVVRRKRFRSAHGASELAQFIPVLYILFMLVFLPLINLGALFLAAAIQYLATNDFAAKASTEPDYPSALNTMATEALLFQSFGLSKFVALVPQGGYVGCGDDLYVVSTNTATGAVTKSGANLPLTQPINTVTSIYELSVKSVYTVAPLINLSQVPLLGDVPGLGQPVTLTFTANRPVEHPSGLQSVDSGGSSSAGIVALFNRVGSGYLPNAASGPNTWRTPDIYDLIQAAGQTVVSENVFVVDANNPSLTSSGISVAPGQEVWIDTQAVGQWTTQTGYLGYTSANGYGWGPGAGDTFPNLPAGTLDGIFEGSGQPAFLVGNTLLNYRPANGATGVLGMMCNDAAGAINYGDNAGKQVVRVIVTQ